MQMSYPSFGDTPALLTRTSILLLRKSEALSHICLQLPLNIVIHQENTKLKEQRVFLIKMSLMMDPI